MCRARRCTGSDSPPSLHRPSQHQPPVNTRKHQAPSTQTIPVQPPRCAVRGSARVQPPHGHSPGPVSTSPRSKPASSRHPQHFLVSRPHQNPCTPAHGSPKTKPGILFSPTGRTLVFRQHQRPGRSRTRLANSKSIRSLASPQRELGGVCLPRSTLKAPAKTSLPPVSTSHPPTRVGGSPRFAKLPPPHSWGGGARKGGGEVQQGRVSQKNSRPKAKILPPHFAPPHPNFHQIFFKNFRQLLSEQRNLCVNNPWKWIGSTL